MHSLKNLLVLINAFCVFFVCTSSSWAWMEKPLIKINDKSYFTDDFKQWWINWKEDDTKFPKDLNEFIEWHLLVEEAKIMELDYLPSYRKKLETFLRVRGVFLLKHEEIDSKISIKDEEIVSHFNDRYNPVWKVNIYSFDNEQSSKDFYNLIKSIDIDKLSIQSNLDEHKGTLANRIFSPISFKNDDAILALLKNMKVGEVSEPIIYSGKHTIVELTSIETRSEDFFISHKDRTFNNLRKMKQSQLTNVLLESLKKKYNVIIDKDLFKIAHNENIDLEFLDKIFITSSNGNILFGTFVNNVRKDTRIRRSTLSSNDDIEKIKESILNGMLFDILIAWEILDKHYENNPPLKGIYEFYKQNRLIVEFNKEVFEKKILINDEDVRGYYNSNLQEFSKPATYSLSILRVENDLGEKILSDIKRGGDFFEIAKKYQHSEPPVQQVSINDLEPELRSVVEELSDGEVSPPVSVKSNMVFIKFISKKPGDVTPFDQVSAGIAEKIYKQTLGRLKSDFLAKLKEKSRISINENQWKSLRKELGDNNGGKDN